MQYPRIVSWKCMSQNLTPWKKPLHGESFLRRNFTLSLTNLTFAFLVCLWNEFNFLKIYNSRIYKELNQVLKIIIVFSEILFYFKATLLSKFRQKNSKIRRILSAVFNSNMEIILQFRECKKYHETCHNVKISLVMD